MRWRWTSDRDGVVQFRKPLITAAKATHPISLSEYLPLPYHIDKYINRYSANEQVPIPFAMTFSLPRRLHTPTPSPRRQRLPTRYLQCPRRGRAVSVCHWSLSSRGEDNGRGGNMRLGWG